MKVMRFLGYALGALVALVAVAALVVYFVSQRALAGASPQASHLATPSAAELADGERQLHVLGCANCHGPKLQGEIFIDEPKLAKVYAPNLTLIAAKASDAQLDQAIRQGIGHDGRALVIMPSEGYQFLTDAETAALIAAIRATPKGGQEQPARSIGPVGRIGLLAGKFQTTPDLVKQYRASPIPDFGAQFARGRHLVATNCAECHGPDLKGKEVKPGEQSADLAIAGAYDLNQFKALLRKGVAPGKKLGLMGAVARSDFKNLNDDEIAAIHDYLVERAKRMP
jgi:mono/diheme cytochrome c family protein